MEPVAYIAFLRKRADTLDKIKTSLLASRTRSFSAPSMDPSCETTDAHLKDLERRRTELCVIADLLEQGRPLHYPFN